MVLQGRTDGFKLDVSPYELTDMAKDFWVSGGQSMGKWIAVKLTTSAPPRLYLRDITDPVTLSGLAKCKIEGARDPNQAVGNVLL